METILTPLVEVVRTCLTLASSNSIVPIVDVYLFSLNVFASVRVIYTDLIVQSEVVVDEVPETY